MSRLIDTAPTVKHLTACALLILSISACQPPSSIDTPAVTDWSCQTLDKPFAYSACGVDAQTLTGEDYKLQLFWQGADTAAPLLTFNTLLSHLAESQTLIFAMNAGMYNDRFAPIGYTVIEGEEVRALNLKEGGGNFHLLPNGVLWWDKANNIRITESAELEGLLQSGQAQPWYATQSGPMLVIDGAIHPKFNPDSRSLKFRNGAGVCSDGSIQFVNSEVPVSFYQFAELFKDDLNCPNVLFLDGGIASALYAPSIDRHDKKEMGVMVGMVATKE